MPRNSLMDLTNLIFEEIERISDEELTGDALDAEIRRGHAIGKLAETVIHSGDLMLQTAKFRDSQMDVSARMPQLLDSNAQRR